MLPHCPPGAMRHLARRMALGLVGGDAVVPRVLNTSRGVDAHHPSHDHFAPVLPHWFYPGSFRGR